MKKFMIMLLSSLSLFGCRATDNSTHLYAIENYHNPAIVSAQKFASIKKILNRYVTKFEADNAIFLLMDPQNASLLSSYSTDKKPSMLQAYESGSIFDTFTVAMGLEKNIVRPESLIEIAHPLTIDNYQIKDTRISSNSLTPSEILHLSSNIGTAKIALQSGGSLQYEFLKDLGILDDIDLGNTITAYTYYPKRSKWISNDLRIATISYGFGIRTTPLHLITAYSALLNGGLYHTPNFDFSNQERRVISPQTSDIIRQTLRKNVLSGSARQANIRNADVIAKTGTAQKIENEYYTDKVRTTIIGSFHDATREYTFLVMMDNPHGSKATFNLKTAGWNAAPLAGEIIQELIK